MFVETKREGEVTTKEPSRAGFIAWLRQQDPNKEYDYMDCKGRCLIGLYLGSIGHPWKPEETMKSRFYGSLNRVAVQEPWTFGAALKRIRG